MKTKHGYPMFLLLLIAASLFGCSGTTPDAQSSIDSGGETLNVDVADAKADRIGAWKAHAPGLTMWLGTTIAPHLDGATRTWILSGRVSKTMDAIRAYDGHGHRFDAQMVSSRKFEVTLSDDDATKLVSGARLFFDFFPRRGATSLYHGTARYAPRFARWSGRAEIFVLRAINPVIEGRKLRFRGRARAGSGMTLELVYTDDDAGPDLSDDGSGHYHFDWPASSLLLAADPPTDPVYFRVTDGESHLQKQAHIDLRLVQIGLTTEDALQTWPLESCTPEVKSCLENLDGVSDTEPCGYANQVQACVTAGVTLPEGPSPHRFLTDLADTLRSWYADHGSEVRAHGGQTLRGALNSLTVDRVSKLDSLEAGTSFEYDPSVYDVYWYPDPFYPNSARLWYGVYEPSGRLKTVYAVN